MNSAAKSTSPRPRRVSRSAGLRVLQRVTRRCVRFEDETLAGQSGLEKIACGVRDPSALSRGTNRASSNRRQTNTSQRARFSQGREKRTANFTRSMR